MATIIKREGVKGTSFQVRYRIDGKQRTKSFAVTDNTKKAIESTKKDAEKFANNIEAKKTLGEAKDESNITFGKYAETFMKIYLGKRKTTTKKSYLSLLNMLNKDLSNKKIKNIYAQELDNLFLKYQEKYTLNTMKVLYTILNLIFNSAVKKDVILYNPTTKMDFKFIEEDNIDKKSKVLDIYLINQIINFLNSSSLKYKHFVQVAINTGMRRGEVLAIKWININLKENYILVSENYNKYNEVTSTKNKRKRIIPINKTFKNTLLDIKKYQDEMKQIFGLNYCDNDLVVCHENGNYLWYGSIDLLFTKITNEFRHVTAHMLRHTFGTMLRGTEIKDVQEMFGHAKPETTVNIYQHHDEFKKETINALDKKFKFIN
jgi:integrase